MLFLLACTATDPAKDDTAAPDDSGPAEDDTGTTTTGLAAVEVIHVETADGLTLEADWYAANPGDPAVLFLHMSPANGYDRTVWPVEFINSLRDEGFAVLALDRRGAGGSEGEPEDAPAEPGVWDARAAVDFMVDAGIGDLVIIGGSNGTTTTWDYTVTAAAQGYPEPVTIVFMSPGSYTESQHDLEEHDFPHLMFAYPESEATWNERQFDLNPGSWRFEQYAGSTHAAPILAENPTVAEDIRAWLLGEADPGQYSVE